MRFILDIFAEKLRFLPRRLRAVLIFIPITLITLGGTLTRIFMPALAKYNQKSIKKFLSCDTKEYENLVLERFHWTFFKRWLNEFPKAILYREAFIGEAAPNATVLKYKDGKKVQLLDYQQLGRPLLINFGNCT
jgi:hypothetical protein